MQWTVLILRSRPVSPTPRFPFPTGQNLVTWPYLTARNLPSVFAGQKDEWIWISTDRSCHRQFQNFLSHSDFPGGPVVKNPSSNAGDTGSIPGQGTKIPHAIGQLSPRISTREPTCCKLQSPRALEPVRHN